MRVKAIMQARADRRRAIESKAEHAVALWAARASGTSPPLVHSQCLATGHMFLQLSCVMLSKPHDADGKHCQCRALSCLRLVHWVAVRWTVGAGLDEQGPAGAGPSAEQNDDEPSEIQEFMQELGVQQQASAAARWVLR